MENYGLSIDSIKKYGKIIRPYLGVRYTLINQALADANKLAVNYGALIVRENFGEPAIIERSTAEKAGLKEYDVILEADRKKITEDNPLSEVLASHKIGDEISFKILRDRKEIDLKAKLEEEK